jgi:hypothetical protein
MTLFWLPRKSGPPQSYDSRAQLRRQTCPLYAPAVGVTQTKEAIMKNAVQFLGNAIVHGDCLKVFPDLSANSVDFILTDPPYINRCKSRDGRTVPNDDNDA